MPSIQEYAAVCFGESNKDTKKDFDEDCIASMWTLKNRVNDPNPRRYPNPLDGYSSVGGKEWNKFISGNFTKNEEWFAKRAYQLAGAVARGEIDDTTGGANHMYNFKLDAPNEWNTRFKEEDAPMYEMWYKETYRTKSHSYHKETLRTPKKKEKKATKKKE